MEIGSFSAFLSERIKVGGKAGALGEAVSVDAIHLDLKTTFSRY